MSAPIAAPAPTASSIAAVGNAGAGILSVPLAWVSFGLIFVDFNVTFFPMHHLGLRGMPRRVYTYLPEQNWGGLNLLATCGVLVLALGLLCFLVNVLWSRYGAVAGNNPWGAGTLE